MTAESLQVQDPVLTKFATDNMAAIMKRKMFIAEAFYGGIQGTDIDSFKIPRWDFSEVRRPRNDGVVNSGDPTPEINAFYELVPAAVEEIRLGAPITKQEKRQNPNGEEAVRVSKTNLVMVNTLVGFEAKAAALAAAFTKTLATTNAAWGSAGADVPADLVAAINQYQSNCGLLPTHMTLGVGLYRRMAIDSSWRNYVKGSSNAGVIPLAETEAALEAMFGQKIKLLVGSMYYNSAKRDTTPTVTGTALWSASEFYFTQLGEDPMSEVHSVAAWGVNGEDNVVYRGVDTSDPAAGIERVQHKLCRKGFVLAEQACMKFTGV